MGEFIKAIFSFLPPEGNAIVIVATLCIFLFFAERFIKWFLIFYTDKQKERDVVENAKYEQIIKEKELEIKRLQSHPHETDADIREWMSKAYEKIKDLNNRNTGVTREEFDSLVSQIRNTESMTRTELNELSSKVNQILGRLSIADK